MMKKIWILYGLLSLLLSGCASGGPAPAERAAVGRIGEDIPISREMAAKTIALAFYTPEELDTLAEQSETGLPFSDVSPEDWAAPYILGSMEQGFFAGDEEGLFRPQDSLSLWEAQALMDRLAPDYDSRIVLTDENKNMAVSYDLWAQLLETALKSRRAEDSLYSYGIREQNAVLLSAEGKQFDTGNFRADGLDLTPYEASRITFLEKDGEIVLLLTVEALSPIVQNIYCHAENGTLFLETGTGTAELPYREKLEEGFADVKLENSKPAEVTPIETLGRQTVKRVDSNGLYLAEKGALEWTENARIYRKNGDSFVAEKPSALVCGTDLAEYYEKDGKIAGAVINKDVLPEHIRVFLKGSEQERVTLSADGGMTFTSRSASKSFPEGAKATLTADLPWFDNGILTVTGENGCPIQVNFTDGTSFRYEGVLELERRSENGFTIVNELPMERYLAGVVPYEMPVSFGQTALEAQAITARSYAYHQFYGNTYGENGGHVADTVASQVYRGYEENETVEAAVKATEGKCVTIADKVAQTYFYSTSCGFGSCADEVWSTDGTFSSSRKEYLAGQTHGDFEAPTDEEGWLAFWQDWETEGYDSDSAWYRWKVYFSGAQLTEILEKTLAEVSRSNPQLVLLRQADGSFRAGTPQGSGKLQGLAVSRRGEGGVAMELELTFEKGTVCVRTEYAIRRTLSPTKLTIGDDIYLQRKSGGSLTGNTILPSGFFAVKEMRNEEGALTGVAFYGGGNGHGVGMSQYGAKKLAEMGKTPEEILAHYFPGTTVQKVM